MPCVYARFYAELNDHLPRDKQYRRYAVSLSVPCPLAEVIQQEGVPLAEIDVVLVNGNSVGADCLLRDGDSLSAYPVFETFDVTPLVRLRARPLRQVKFVLDVHLGKLASFLRMLGFDAVYANAFTDEQLVSRSIFEGRVLLSRDRRLIAREELTRGYLVRAEAPRRQLQEVIERFELRGSFAPFTRCIPCNALLVPVDKRDVFNRLPVHVRGSFQEFSLCPLCRRVYWQGSHYEKMRAFVETLRTGKAPDDSPQG
jgi:uncharacterized protein with PIN domain